MDNEDDDEVLLSDLDQNEAMIETVFDRIVRRCDTDYGQNELITRALKLGACLLEAGNRSARRCDCSGGGARKEAASCTSFIYLLLENLTSVVSRLVLDMVLVRITMPHVM